MIRKGWFAHQVWIGFKDLNPPNEGPFPLDDLTKSAFLNRPDLHVETEGEFAGWRTWSRDNFESHNGPFWHRMEDDGSVRCAFRVEKKHLNGMRNVHGGASCRLRITACSPLPHRCCRGRR